MYVSILQTIVKNQLSVWIRNHRALEKRQTKLKQKQIKGEIKNTANIDQ